jgi:protein-S-isoprenylcysteine O-methyltransferase Ste14
MYGGLILAGAGITAASGGGAVRMLMELLLLIVLDQKVCMRAWLCAQLSFWSPTEMTYGITSELAISMQLHFDGFSCGCMQASYEESLLKERYGDEYVELSKKTKKLIPFIY